VLAHRPVTAAIICALFLAAPATAGVLQPSRDTVVGPSAASTPTGPVKFVVPLRALVSSPFGPRWGGFHYGIDIEGWQRTDVHAAAPGVVERVGWLPHYEGYGFVVVIRHSRALMTMYAHLAHALVKKGQHVEAGQHIAKAGCTGSCYGTHLHFEVHLYGKAVDPMRWLRGKMRFR
jgi:murein DD-endopeptidase MepM/ murein hydrolase activator NlpD